MTLWLGLVAIPFFLSSDLVSIGVFCLVYVIAVLGLNLQTGWAGQLSLGHVFFFAVGAYSYTYLSAAREVADPLSGRIVGAALSPPIALVLAGVLAAIVGLCISPLSGRLSGLYLGIGSLAFVFIGQQFIANLETITGGVNGRRVPGLSFFGFEVDSVQTTILGVPIGRAETLWWILLVATALAYFVATGITRGRTGVAFTAIRTNEALAAAMGVNVFRYKAVSFIIAATYAGVAGAFYAVAATYVSPESFTLFVTFHFLAAVVIGGEGSLGGGSVAAAAIAALPLLGARYAESLPLVSVTPGQGITGGQLSEYVYGGLIVVVLLVGGERWKALSRRLRIPASASAAAYRSRTKGHSPVNPEGESSAN